MKNFEGLVSILREFEKKYEAHHHLLPTPDRRMQYSEAIAMYFEPCAAKILAGHFLVTNTEGEKSVVRIIQPTAIELYYHEEGEGRFKDPIMYHTNDRKVSYNKDYFDARGIEGLPYYPIGSLNPHTSGIDVTFENAKEHYRASFLIREYTVKYEGGVEQFVKNSTDIYDDLLLNGIPIDDADWVEWCEGEPIHHDQIERRWRRNVADYTEVSPGKWEKNDLVEGRDCFTLGGIKYVKCPFNWQFRGKQ